MHPVVGTQDARILCVTAVAVSLGAAAFQAVNGDASGTDENVCTHTQYDHEPWWEVDLGCVMTIDRIVVNSRMPNTTDFPQRICPYFILGAVNSFDGFTGSGRCGEQCLCALRCVSWCSSESPCAKVV